VLSGGAAARVGASELKELVVTDSIWSGEADAKGGKVRRLTVAPLLAEAIKRIADEASVSSLFD
jgi:ribose-phosphate pyrophosphokinase